MSHKHLPWHNWCGCWNILIFLVFGFVLVVTTVAYQQQQQQQTAMAHDDDTEKSSAMAPPVEKAVFSPIMLDQAKPNKDEHQTIDPAKFADAECVIEVKKIEYVPGKCVRLWGTGSTKKNACASYHGGFMEPFSPDCK